ncbi:MAG: hypothetical protein WB626_08260 [Bacteroidota bacterium]
MTISILDASHYLRGLLLLLRKDRRRTEEEISLILRVGKTLGFEREFCENAAHEILENEHIEEDPPRFSSPDLAEMFLRDGLTVASSDSFLDPSEEEWILEVAAANGIGPERFRSIMEECACRPGGRGPLEAEKLSVRHT